MVGGAFFRFLLLDTMMNCLSSPSSRAATFSAMRGGVCGAVPCMISTRGSPDVVQVERVVVSFEGLGPEFVCRWGGLLCWLAWMLLDVLAVLILFEFDLFIMELTMKVREAI